MPIPFTCKPMTKLLFFVLPFAALAETGYEPNNNLDEAQPIFINESAQAHKFDFEGDEDWLVFYAQEGTPYDIEIESDSVGQGINPALELYNENGEVEISLFDFNFAGEGELLSWNGGAKGFYYIRVINTASEFSVEADYKIKVFLPSAPPNGRIKGSVVDQCTQTAIRAELIATVTQKSNHQNGEFGMVLDPGIYDITAHSEGYEELIKTATVEQDKTTPIQFDLMPIEGCPVEPEPEPLEITARYNDQNRTVTIDDVMFGNDHYQAELIHSGLTDSGDILFNVKTASKLDAQVLQNPNILDVDTLALTLNKVSVSDKYYKVVMKHLGDLVFQLETPLEEVLE